MFETAIQWAFAGAALVLLTAGGWAALAAARRALDLLAGIDSLLRVLVARGTHGEASPAPPLEVAPFRPAVAAAADYSTVAGPYKSTPRAARQLPPSVPPGDTP